MLYLPGEFPLSDDLIYLNHAAVAPWPRRTAEAVQRFAFENMTRGAADYPAWMRTVESLRGHLAQLIGVDSSDDIALVKNTSEGLSLVAYGLEWQAGDEIVGIAGDFPSNTVVWESLAPQGVNFHGVDILAADDPEQALFDACGEHTRLLAISSVHFATGLRLDLARISLFCRTHEILLCVDAIQSLGALRLDLRETPVDFLTADGHKWMLGPEGLGVFYCRAALRERLHLHQFGWAMRAHPGNFDSPQWLPSPTATRFECGSPNMLGIHALDCSLGLLLEFGMDAIEQRVLTNNDCLRAGLAADRRIELITPDDLSRRSGIVSFRIPGLDSSAIYQRLMSAGVICAPRGGGIRFSPHFYTTQAQLERALEVLFAVLDTWNR